jgi:Ca-activated chloride channel family protein
VAFTEQTKKEALDFIAGMKAIGGTNMDNAFELALKEKPSQDRPSMIIFITDGKPTIGETDESKLLQKINGMNTGNQRIFTFGVGYDLNSRLLDKLTEAAHGYRTYVTPEEDIEVKVSDFFTKVSSPVLSDIKISFADDPNAYNVFPKAIPDLFRGSSVTLFGRYRKPGTTQLIVEGKVNGKPQKFTYDVVFGENNTRNEFIAPLWATRNVGFLLDQIRLHGETQELKDEVVALSKEYGIITPYTSYLILEDEEIQTVNRRITTEQQLFAPRVSNDGTFRQDQKVQFDDLRSGSGEGSINSSMKVQEYGFSTNLEKSKETDKKLSYRDNSGTERNLSEETRNINGRAMYQVGNEWVDVNVQKTNNYKTNRVQFASKEYFDLLEKEPSLSQYLALGRNVRFVHNNQNYEVFE